MKKVLQFLFCCLLFILVSCDKISHPIVVKETVAGSKFVTKSNSDVSNNKKILLEDYTGQRCQNCPGGASLIKTTLLPQYGYSLVVIAVHEGDLYAKPFGIFKNDFRTTAGETWGSSSAGFGIDQWPTALVNRKNYASNGIKLSSTSKWTSVVSLASKDPFVVKLDLKTEYDTSARALNTYVKATFKTSYTNAIKLVAVYLEDGIIGLQTDGAIDIPDYEFEHMLRGDITGTWGVDLTPGAVATNDTASLSFKDFPLPLTAKDGKGLSINDKNVSVVVFAYDAITREVLQAEKVKIR